MQAQEQKILDQLREENRALREENGQLRDEVYSLKHGRTLDQAAQDMSARRVPKRDNSQEVNRSVTLKVEDLRTALFN